jgi:hypothetical protein
LWARFGLCVKTSKNEECAVATVYLPLLESSSVYRFICRIADSTTQAKKVDENRKERRIDFNFCFKQMIVLKFASSNLIEQSAG